MSDDEPSTELRVHIDTLEYTRQGLRTKTPLQLEVGRHHRVQLVRPEPLKPIRAAATGFPHESAFPTPGTLCISWSLKPGRSPFAHSEVRSPTSADRSFQIFGHTSPSGDDDHNKALSERRARVGVALLTSDGELLGQVADEEGWELSQGQAMLRTLALNPGPADGKMGRLTEDAMREFADRYERGVFHREASRAATEDAVPTEGGWTDAFMRALLDAFAVAHGVALPEASIFRAEGCSEFNALPGTGTGQGRRLSVVSSDGPPPYPESAPCTEGDAGACAVVDDNTQRCLWYREHVSEPEPPIIELFDPRWLWISDDRYVLSALTTASDEHIFDFEVFEDNDGTQRPLSLIEGIRPVLGTLSVVWCSETTADETGQPMFEGRPIFRVQMAGTEISLEAPWKGRATARVLLGSSETAPSKASETFRLYASDGSYEQSVSASEAQRISPQKVAVVFEDVPEGSLLNLAYGIDGSATYDLFRNVELEAMQDNCAVGNACVELPPLEPPLVPPEGLPEHLDRAPHIEDEADAIVQPPW